MRAEDARTQKLIDTSMAVCVVHCSEKRDLLSSLTDPPSTSMPPTARTKRVEKLHLPALTDAEQKLIRDYTGCTRCQKLNVGHSFSECLMIAMNTWPDTASYMMLTALKRGHHTGDCEG